MRRITAFVSIMAALAAPATAQEESGPDMTCGEFLALDGDAQVAAMLVLRADEDGAEISVEEEAEDAAVVTNATEAGAMGGADGARPTVPDMAITPESRQRAEGMRTACLGMDDMPALDALMAAHADYDPVFETELPTE